MKKYITAISLQQHLKPMAYQSMDHDRLAFTGTTRFPIIPVISNSVNAGDCITVVPVLTGTKAIQKNYQYFLEELETRSSEQSFTYRIEPVQKRDDEKIETILKLFADIIKKVKDGDRLYACMTYGTKPVSIVVNMVLNFAYKVKSDVTISQIVYGLKDFSDPTGQRGELYDITALFYMDSVIGQLAQLNPPNPETAMLAMLSLDE